MTQVMERLLERYPDLNRCAPAIRGAYELLERSYRGGGKLLVCGNGGSAADSEHIVGELMKGFVSRRPVPAEFRQKLGEFSPQEADYLADHLQGALPAIALVSHTALSSAYANDVAADMIYAQQVYGYGRPGDALLGISTSGNATNVANALRVARALGMSTIGLTGRDGGAMVSLCDVAICAPGQTTAEIQERHLPIYHALCMMLEEAFFSA
jgi:D-sedoheptulose 7-phosphate isomerase